MLAEPRRKHKIGPNPRGKFFTEDDDNRGRQMLMKMGWKTGDGLGANCHGMSEPIKPKINTESRGLGFDRKQDPWVAHNEEFEQLLKSLNSNSSDADGLQGVDDPTGEAIRGSSKDALEKKSKGSKSRIHYHKFVKNKDLSRASSKDMSGIFGKSLDTTLQVHLPPTIIADYAESLESKGNGGNSEEMTCVSAEIAEEVGEPGESQNEIKKRKKKRKKNKEIEETPSPDEEHVMSQENLTEQAEGTERKSKKKKRKQKERTDEPDFGHNSNDNNIEEVHTECISEKDPVDQDDDDDASREIRKKKKKSKKRKREDDIESQGDIDILQNILEPTTTDGVDEPEPSSEEAETKKKKKKKSKKAHREEICEEISNGTPNVSAESEEAVSLQKEAEPNKDTIPSEKDESLGTQFINRGSIVDYFRNKRLQMLNRTSANSLNIA